MALRELAKLNDTPVGLKSDAASFMIARSPVLLSQASTNGLAAAFKKDKFVEESTAYLSRHNQKRCVPISTTNITQDEKRKELLAILGKTILAQAGCETLLDVPLSRPSDVDWIRQCFDLQLWRAEKCFEHSGVTSFCLPEVRVLLQGSYLIAGVPWDRVGGLLTAEKVKNFQQMTSEELNKLVKECGFFGKHSEIGSAIAIPAGFLVSYAMEEGSVGASGFRWGVQPTSKERDVLAQQLRQMMDELPVLRASAYKNLSDWVSARAENEAQVVPAP